MVVQPDLFEPEESDAPREEETPVETKVEPTATATQQYTIRPYQLTAVENTFQCWEEARSCLLLCATGTGKTATAGFTARRIIEGGGNYLFLAHRTELVRQGYRAMRAINPDVGVAIEQAQDYVDVRSGKTRIVVASKDSLKKDSRLTRFARDYFAAITVDECHHAVEGKTSYTRIFDHFQDAKIQGITATADRADEIALGTTFDSVAFEYSILDGIRDGFLVPIVQQLEVIEGFDLSRVSETARGDLNEVELAEEMRSKKMLHAIATASVKYSTLQNGQESNRPTLIFCASVEHAQEVADILNRWDAERGTGRAATVNSVSMSSDEVSETLDAFRKGRIQYLTNYGILTEGADLPSVRVVVIGRLTKSRALYTQMCGRVIRPLTEITSQLNSASTPEERKAVIRASRKPAGLIVDLVGVSGAHKLISTLDVLGGKFPDEVVEAAKTRIKNAGGRADAASMDRVLQEEAEKLSKKRREKVILEAKLTSRIVDPFDLLDLSETREPGWFKGKKPTERMREVLERNGVDKRTIEEMSFFKASKIIEEIVKRAKTGLCSLRQAKILEAAGLNTNVSYQEAKRLISELGVR